MDKPKFGFKFKPAKKTKSRTSIAQKKLSKLIHCICIYDKKANEWRASIIVNTNPHQNILTFPFTLDSYSLKGKIRVFSVKKDKLGKRICFIRTPYEAMASGETSKTKIPFCENWVYTGHLVKISNQIYFNIKEAIFHRDFVKQSLEVNINELKDIKI